MEQKNLSGDKKPWSLVGDGKDAYVSCPAPVGWSTTIVRGVEVAIPPEGYVHDPVTRQMVYVGVDKKNTESDDFYWIRQGLPKNYEDKLREESLKQAEDSGYFDPDIENFRQNAWIRRLGGCWFANGEGGVPTYITGLHYYYLEWCFIAAFGNKGYPSFRDTDRRFFLYLEHIIRNPNCFGTILLTKRRMGKTQMSVAFGLEPVTRLPFSNFGIQSKTDEDAQKVVFKDSAIRMFSRMPDFFKPVHDDRRLNNISNTLIFKPKQTDVEAFKKGNYLGGWIEHRSSSETAFDGTKLHRYVGDEVFKTRPGVDVYERWNIVKFCLIVDGKIRGKAMLTSTVEEIEGSTEDYVKMYADSDQLRLDSETGRTKTGLFRYFIGADEARDFDKYGMVDREKNRDRIIAERRAYADDVMSYNSMLRKEPLTVEEAFRFLSRESIFDTAKISDQIDAVVWRQDEFVERGNYIWKTYGKEVQWVPTQKGRWLRVKGYAHPENSLSGESYGYRTDYEPNGKELYCCGIDPFSHSKVEGRQKSDGAFYIKRKHDPMNPDVTDMFVVQYLYRTAEVEAFYEDVFITLFHYGCLGLIENQKIGLVGYFENARVHNFLVKLKNQKNYGIAASRKTTQAMCELIEKYIYDNIHKVYFVDLLKDWANFDIERTQSFDAAMASGYTLLADSKILLKKGAEKTVKIIEIGDLF